MSAVLVTGGTGLVGRFIVEALIAAGHAVTVAGRTPPAGEAFSTSVGFRPLDLEPDADFAGLLSGMDHLVHGAFHHVEGRYRGGEGDDPEGFRRINRDGTIALFAAAKARGLKRCVFLSSRAVYGTQVPGTVLTEDTKCRPDTLYGEVKLDAETALAELCSPGFAAASLRVTGVYGAPRPGQPHKWEALFEDYLAGRPIAPRAGTEVHGRDVGRAVRLMLEAPTEAISSRIFNVTDILVDRRALLAVVQERTGCPYALPDSADVDNLNPMTDAALRALSWVPGGWPLLRQTVARLL